MDIPGTDKVSGIFFAMTWTEGIPRLSFNKAVVRTSRHINMT